MQSRTYLLQIALLALSSGSVLSGQAIPPMAATADPTFAVATIKPANPERAGKNFTFEGHQVEAINYNVNDIIALAYGMHPHQIIGAPAWFGSTLYDIAGVPDTSGIPNQTQKDRMMQKLLAERFQLRFHVEQRRLAVYAITIAPGGPRITPTDAGPDALSRFQFKSGLHGVRITNMTLTDFAMWFQKTVTDRPVLNRTGLHEKYTFELNWTPDDSQFAQLLSANEGPDPPSHKSTAPPGLFTAIQQQLGLKLQPVRTATDVIVIDHAERPSPN